MRWMRVRCRVIDNSADLDKSTLLNKNERVTLFAAVPFRLLGLDQDPLG